MGFLDLLLMNKNEAEAMRYHFRDLLTRLRLLSHIFSLSLLRLREASCLSEQERPMWRRTDVSDQ